MAKPITQAGLARKLQLTQQRISALHRRGMPIDSVAAARAWRRIHVDQVRAKPDPRMRAAEVENRNAILAERRRKLELENGEREGALVRKVEVSRQFARRLTGMLTALENLIARAPLQFGKTDVERSAMSEWLRVEIDRVRATAWREPPPLRSESQQAIEQPEGKTDERARS